MSPPKCAHFLPRLVAGAIVLPHQFCPGLVVKLLACPATSNASLMGAGRRTGARQVLVPLPRGAARWGDVYARAIGHGRWGGALAAAAGVQPPLREASGAGASAGEAGWRCPSCSVLPVGSVATWSAVAASVGLTRCGGGFCGGQGARALPCAVWGGAAQPQRRGGGAG